MNSRKPPSKQKETYRPCESNAMRWQEKLPATPYAAVLTGLHAKTPLGKAVDWLLPGVKLPKPWEKAPLGALTPDIIAMQPELFATPIDKRALLQSRPELEAAFHASHDDGVREVLTNLKTGAIRYDPGQPTLADIAYVAQTIYLGYQARMGQLVQTDFCARLDNLSDAKTYRNFTAGIQATLKLHGVKPNFGKQAPQLHVARRDGAVVKQVGSGMEKAHTRSGQAKSIKDWLAAPEKYGVFGVDDALRNSLLLSDHKDGAKNWKLKQYLEARDYIILAALSGHLGMTLHPDEISDNILYPGKKLSDQYPVLKMKGEYLHRGPDNSLLVMPLEMQLVGMSQHTVQNTHYYYEQWRTATNDEDKDYFGRERQSSFDQAVEIFSPEAALARKMFVTDGKVAEQDSMAVKSMRATGYDITGGLAEALNGQALRLAQRTALQAVDDDQTFSDNVTRFDPFSSDPHSQAAFKGMLYGL